MNAVPRQVSSLESSPWGQVASIYRRICVLRAKGDDAHAARLHATEFSPLLESIQRSAGPSGDTGERLRAVLDAEEERVANASALAELLLPLLTESLTGLLSASVGPAPLAEVKPINGSHPARAGRPPPGSPPSVADLIEGMLAQERAEPRAASRRAS